MLLRGGRTQWGSQPVFPQGETVGRFWDKCCGSLSPVYPDTTRGLKELRMGVPSLLCTQALLGTAMNKGLQAHTSLHI